MCLHGDTCALPLITAPICAYTQTEALTCTVLISTVVHMYVSAHTQTHVYLHRLIHVCMHIHSDGHTPNTFHPLLPAISVSTVPHGQPSSSSVCGHPPKLRNLTDPQVQVEANFPKAIGKERDGL